MLLVLISLVGIPLFIALKFIKKDDTYWKYAALSAMMLIISFIGVGITGDSPSDTSEESSTEASENLEEDVDAESESKEEAAKEKEAEEEEARRREELSQKKAEESEEAKLEKKYRKFITGSADEFQGYLEDFSIQTSTYTYTNEWIEDTAKVVANIRYITAKIITYDLDKVPEIYQETHEAYVAGAIKYSESMDLFVDGVDSMDPDLIEAATNKIKEGNEYIRLSTKLIQEANSTLEI